MAILHRISEACDSLERTADLVFVHGLGGDAFGTWRHSESGFFWPKYLAEEFPEVGVWSLDYAASKFKAGRLLKFFVSGLSEKWGHAMPLPMRASNVLRTLMLNDIGERPLVLVCHSLGGLIAKEALRQSHRATADSGMQKISRNTRAVMFLATPHQGASLASYLHAFRHFFGATVAIADLRAFDRHLLELLGWYSGHAHGRYDTVSYTEARRVGEILLIVDRFSGNPEVGAVNWVDENHLSIAKPAWHGHDIVLEVRRMLGAVIESAASKGRAGEAHASQLLLGRDACDDRQSVPIRTTSPIPWAIRFSGHAFRGRAQILATLVERLSSGRSTAVVGDAGMGKTALAVEALQIILGRDAATQCDMLRRSVFPDGIVFLDLYRHEGQAERVWRALANDLGAPVTDAAGKEIPALERAVGACVDKCLLLVVEGGEEARGCADDEGFVRITRTGLLEPLNFKGTVLWLTRRGDQWPAHESLYLDDPLAESEACALFDELAADPVSCAARVPICMRDRALALLHGHPLAITWVAAMMASGSIAHDDMLADLASDPGLSLHEPAKKEHTLAWLFSRSLRALDADARRSLFAAGLLAPESFPRAAIASATGLDDRAQRVALEACLAVRLLRHGVGVGDAATAYCFNHVLGYGFARTQAIAFLVEDPGLLSKLAEWTHSTLRAGLAMDASATAFAEVPNAMSHAFVLMAADSPPGLWEPLVSGLLYGIGDRLQKMGLVVELRQSCVTVEQWLKRAQASCPQEARWIRETMVCHGLRGRLDFDLGDVSSAQKQYFHAMEIAEKVSISAPENTGFKRDIGLGNIRLADVQMSCGNLPAARRHCEIAMNISRLLVDSNPADLESKRVMGLAHERLGVIGLSSGEVLDAKLNFEKKLQLTFDLVASDGMNLQWRRELIVGHELLGRALEALGDMGGAQRQFESALDVSVHLAENDPDNIDLKRDLCAIHERLGDLLLKSGDLDGAQRHIESRHLVSAQLALRDRDDMGAQHDLSVALERLGHLREMWRDLTGAKKFFGDALSIRKRIAALVPTNMQWQSALGISHSRMGGVFMAQGDFSAAREHYSASMKIRMCLVAQDETNSMWKRELSACHDDLGDLLIVDDELFAAKQHYDAGLAIMDGLATKHPRQMQWRHDLSKSHAKMARVCGLRGEISETLAHLYAAREILRVLCHRMPDQACYRNDLVVMERNIVMAENANAGH